MADWLKIVKLQQNEGRIDARAESAQSWRILSASVQFYLLGVIGLAALLCFSKPVLAVDAQAISKLEQFLDKQEQRLSDEEKQLRQLEARLTDLYLSHQSLTQEVQRLSQQQLETASQQVLLQNQVNELMKGLDREIIFAISLKQKSSVPLITSSDALHQRQRQKAFYDYWMRSKQESIHMLDQTLIELQGVSQELEARTSRLESESLLLSKKLGSIEQMKTQREQLIEQIREQIRQTQNELVSHRQDENQLTQLIEHVDDAVVIRSQGLIRFNRGNQLLCPVNDGRKILNYGQLRRETQLRSNGILVRAKLGEPVQAIADGEVVYSDWLRGYGWLIIVEHADQWFSVYGHNQTLERTIGDRVRKGEVISTVGDSGGQNKPALYFELRKQAEPRNSNRWCENEG